MVLSSYPDRGLCFCFGTSSIPSCTITDDVSSSLLESSDAVVGLPDSEWISIFFRASGEYDLLVRMRQGQPSSLEVWVDGDGRLENQ